MLLKSDTVDGVWNNLVYSIRETFFEFIIIHMCNRIFSSHKCKYLYIIKNIISYILILSTNTNIEQSAHEHMPLHTNLDKE